MPLTIMDDNRIMTALGQRRRICRLIADAQISPYGYLVTEQPVGTGVITLVRMEFADVGIAEHRSMGQIRTM